MPQTLKSEPDRDVVDIGRAARLALIVAAGLLLASKMSRLSAKGTVFEVLASHRDALSPDRF